MVTNKLKYKNKIIADAGFVINLKKRTDRKEKITEILNSIGFSNYKFEKGVIFEDPEWRKYGCTQTFLNIFQKAIDNDYKSIIIFEDDAKKMDSIDTSQIDKIFNDWNSNKKKYDLIALGTRPLSGSRIYQDSDCFGTVTNALCAHGFYYTKKFMKYALETLGNFKDSNSPYYKVIIDEFINDCCSHEQIYKTKNKIHRVGITIPMILTQYGSFSDNENQEMNYDVFIEGCFWEAYHNGKKEKK